MIIVQGDVIAVLDAVKSRFGCFSAQSSKKQETFGHLSEIFESPNGVSSMPVSGASMFRMVYFDLRAADGGNLKSIGIVGQTDLKLFYPIIFCLLVG